MSEPGPDFAAAIGQAMAQAPGAAGYVEYRVSPPGDVMPTSGSSLDAVLSAADVPPPGPGPVPASGSVGAEASPVDVSAMGGAVNQWWMDRGDAGETQAMADALNTGADLPPSPGWEPFPPGPDGQVVQ